MENIASLKKLSFFFLAFPREVLTVLGSLSPDFLQTHTRTVTQATVLIPRRPVVCFFVFYFYFF